MAKSRKVRHNYTPDEKIAILRKHLLEKVSVADLCEAHQLQPLLFYAWQKQFFENGAAAFTVEHRKTRTAVEKKIAELEAKLVRKNEVLSELMEEHIQLKKEYGEL
jgi:transposase-like protein